MKIRTYTELKRIDGFEKRFEYLKLNGSVGQSTFGFDRYLNQVFYRSKVWKNIRRDVVLRDEGLDLGVFGYDIHDFVIVHHMNPISVDDLTGDNVERILDPEFLISCSRRTHRAIHFGDKSQIPRGLIERKPGDTKLW